MAVSDDVLREILVRLNDAADLFRCATTCKRWCGLVADPSFLRLRWPEHARPSFAGFFIKDRGRYQGAKVLVPMPSSELGPRRRALSSFVPGDSADLLHHAVPQCSSRGLLLVRLASQSAAGAVHLAVCNLLAGTWDVLLPIQLDCQSRAGERSGYAIVTGTDYCSGDDEQPPGNSSFFKVIIITVNYTDNLTFHLNMFSSHEASWGMGTVCFKGTIHATGSFCHSDAVMRHGTAHWLFRDERARNFCLLKLKNQDDHVSLAITRLPVSLMTGVGYPCLSLATDGTLSVLQMKETSSQLEIWKLQKDQQSADTTSEWLVTQRIELMHPRKDTQGGEIFYILAEKCGKLLVKDTRERVYTGDLQTGAMEEVVDWPRTRHTSTPNVMPLELDWAAFFVSRLGTVSNSDIPVSSPSGEGSSRKRGQCGGGGGGKTRDCGEVTDG
ncbi:uncharacterized protein LOC119273290 [Triticum dicoccoides]|uniref:uncharacterized protein LOC119273290 n=1 Tax=Triticum dicoccoides TaxID=85692 RepID=UPI00188F170C|nr:uncharacterized protein LOC119273290 [Triticum dicoccoides]